MVVAAGVTGDAKVARTGDVPENGLAAAATGAERVMIDAGTMVAAAALEKPCAGRPAAAPFEMLLMNVTLCES